MQGVCKKANEYCALESVPSYTLRCHAQKVKVGNISLDQARHTSWVKHR